MRDVGFIILRRYNMLLYLIADIKNIICLLSLKYLLLIIFSGC